MYAMHEGGRLQELAQAQWELLANRRKWKVAYAAPITAHYVTSWLSA